jgi:hypothetical protein
MRLVDTLDEQSTLEAVLEASKPERRSHTERRLHYLLETPFRYPPHRHGSRFRRRGQHAGVFYAGETLETTLWEVAFYKFLFRADAPGASLPANAVEHSVFSVRVGSEAALDLTTPPFASRADVWMHLWEYAPCQSFADVARESGIELLRYASVRDPEHRESVAVMALRVFKTTAPARLQSWRFLMKADRVIAFCESPSLRREFPLSAFAADMRLAPLMQRDGS